MGQPSFPKNPVKDSAWWVLCTCVVTWLRSGPSPTVTTARDRTNHDAECTLAHTLTYTLIVCSSK